MIKIFILGMFIGGVLGYTMAALLSIADRGNEEDDE